MLGAEIPEYKDRKLTWHSLRHYAISKKLSAEVDLASLAEISRTSIQQIQNHYGHISRSMGRRAVLKDPVDLGSPVIPEIWDD